MKLNGRKIETPNEVVVALPRPEYLDAEGNMQVGDLIFLCRAVTDYAQFEKLCPTPKPPKVIRPGETVENFEDPTYKAQISEWAERRTNWMILKSLEATPNLEWELVNKSDPTTWHRYEEELRTSGLTEHEMTRIIRGVMMANTLDDAKVKEAEKRFLAGRSAQPVKG